MQIQENEVTVHSSCCYGLKFISTKGWKVKDHMSALDFFFVLKIRNSPTSQLSAMCLVSEWRGWSATESGEA